MAMTAAHSKARAERRQVRFQSFPSFIVAPFGFVPLPTDAIAIPAPSQSLDGFGIVPNNIDWWTD
jgi:hypothetical protein